MTVTSSAELLEALVLQMRGIPGLVAELEGDTANILRYVEDEHGDVVSTIRALRSPKVLVYLESITPTRFPYMLRHAVAMAIRSPRAEAIFVAVLSGVSEVSGADGLPLLVSTVHPRFDPMDPIPSLIRRTIPVNEATVFDYWEISTAFSEKASN